MSNIDVLLGLQFGSEGKGKIAAYLAGEYQTLVRSGGPQAGHTFYKDGVKYVNRQVPCGVFSNCSLRIAPAGMVNIEVLEDEIRRYDLTPSRLLIDDQAMVVTKEHIRLEETSNLNRRLASTCEGVGAAQADKVWRTAVLFRDFVKDLWLEDYAGDVVEDLHQTRGPILVEGTQGFSLSLNHGEYPFVTSRDITSSALLNDVGMSPRDHRRTIGVLRTYPIRVGGNSGRTRSNELTWEEITRRANAKRPIQEFTTVTNNLRRVFEQDFDSLRRAILVNQPDELALMFLDYINADDFGKTDFDDLSSRSRDYVLELEQRLEIPITLIGTGPEDFQIIDRR
jgi:adenylosuccinate synthase